MAEHQPDVPVGTGPIGCLRGCTVGKRNVVSTYQCRSAT